MAKSGEHSHRNIWSPPVQYGGKRYFYSINATKMSFFQLHPRPTASSTFNLSSALLSQLAQTTAIFRFHSIPTPAPSSTANKRSAQWDLAFLRFSLPPPSSFFFSLFFFSLSFPRSFLPSFFSTTSYYTCLPCKLIFFFFLRILLVRERLENSI